MDDTWMDAIYICEQTEDVITLLTIIEYATNALNRIEINKHRREM